jgi:hypothetical protein
VDSITNDVSNLAADTVAPIVADPVSLLPVESPVPLPAPPASLDGGI